MQSAHCIAIHTPLSKCETIIISSTPKNKKNLPGNGAILHAKEWQQEEEPMSDDNKCSNMKGEEEEEMRRNGGKERKKKLKSYVPMEIQEFKNIYVEIIQRSHS